MSNVSLSTYFPKNTQYFYGYPAGEDSGFFNHVPPEVEELVAMRATTCAGPNVSVISYSTTLSPQIDHCLLEKLAIPELSQAQMAVLPTAITPKLRGARRNEAIKQALKEISTDKCLVMAQPYLSQRLKPAYQISAEIITWLNDKQNLNKIIGKSLVPRRLGSYISGRYFKRDYKNLSVPAVVKVSSSSSGDGVYICKTKATLKAAVDELKDVNEPILVEQYIDTVKNYGLHFGIPSDPAQPIDFIGVNEQLTTPEGQFTGGIISSREIPDEIKAAKHYIEYVVLPKVRQMQWYGVGGFDVLVDKSGECFVVDCNFRMTGMSAYHFMIANNQLEPPLLGFSGEFNGTQPELEANLLPLAGKDSKDKIIQLIALSRHKYTWRFNAALMFDDSKELKSRVKLLKQAGILSDTLEQLA